MIEFVPLDLLAFFLRKNMKKLFFGAVFAISTLASAQTWVDGYNRRDGTYVQGHTRSAPNEYRYDNYSSRTNGGSQRDEYSEQPSYNKSFSNPYPVQRYNSLIHGSCRIDRFGGVSCD